MRKPFFEKRNPNKGAWSKQEDQKLIDYIKQHGEGYWHALPKAAGLLRCSKSCRLRWVNYLKPDLKRSNFEEDEIDLIIKLHALLGNRWSLIAGRLPGRTDNEVKNYWNSHLKMRLIRMGLDPNTHRPLPISGRTEVAVTSRYNTNKPTNNSVTNDDEHTQAIFKQSSKSFSNVGHINYMDNSTEVGREKNGHATADCLLLIPDLNLDLSLATLLPPSEEKAQLLPPRE